MIPSFVRVTLNRGVYHASIDVIGVNTFHARDANKDQAIGLVVGLYNEFLAGLPDPIEAGNALFDSKVGQEWSEIQVKI